MTTATTERATIEAGTLRAALADVLKAVPARAPRPILQNVRLGDGLITGTDLELRIDRELDYHGEPVLLPAARLFSIVRELPSDATVSIEPDGTKCKIKAARGSWTLPTEAVLEYPIADVGDLKPVCRLPADQFCRAIKATDYATDTASSRFALGAILLDVVDSNPTFVATDGRRLAIVEAETDQDVGTIRCLMPARAALAAMAAHGDSVQIETDGKVVVFTSAGLTVTGQLIAGSFPRWKDAVPDRKGAKAHTVQRDELLHGVRQAAIVTSEQSKGVALTWTSNTLVLSGRSAEYGESRVKCSVVSAGTTSATKLDPAFLAEFLAHIPHDEEPQVDVYAADPQSRVLLRCGDYTGVIMPLAAE